MRLIVLVICFLSLPVYANEVSLISQHLYLSRQKETGQQFTLSAKTDINRKLYAGLEGTYLERFSYFEKQAGGKIGYKPSDKWTLEGKFTIGNENNLLPERQSTFTVYHALTQGLTPFAFYRDTHYSVTTIQSLNIGAEIEKIPSFIFIPTFMAGKATFNSPAKTSDVYSYGLRTIWYRENKYGISLFAFKGKEASQGIIGESAILVDTLSRGVSGTWYFSEKVKADLIYDHTDYDQLNTKFQTTTLNLTWMF